MAAKILKSQKHFRGPTGEVLTTLGVQNLPEIALSLTIFSEKWHLHFCQNSR